MSRALGVRRVGVGPGLVALAAIFTAAAPLSTDLYLPLMPQLSQQLGASASMATLTITAVLVGLAVGQIFGGPISDQRGRRGVLMTGLVGFAVTNALSALAPSITVLIAIRFASGVAAALAFVMGRAMVADAFEHAERARAYALLGAISGITPVLAPIAGGLLALVIDWRGVFAVLAGLGAVIAVVALLLTPETMPAHRRQQVGISYALADLGTCLRHRRFMGYVAQLACTGGVLFAYIGSSAFVLEGRFGLSATQFAAVFAVNSIGIFIVGLIGRRLLRTVDSNRLLWSGQIVMAIGTCIVLIGLAASILAVVLGGLFIMISPLAIIFANATAMGIAVSPVRPGSASALLGIAGFLVGGLLAPVGSLGGVSMGVLLAAFAVAALVVHRVLAPRSSVTPPVAGSE